MRACEPSLPRSRECPIHPGLGDLSRPVRDGRVGDFGLDPLSWAPILAEAGGRSGTMARRSKYSEQSRAGAVQMRGGRGHAPASEVTDGPWYRWHDGWGSTRRPAELDPGPPGRRGPRSGSSGGEPVGVRRVSPVAPGGQRTKMENDIRARRRRRSGLPLPVRRRVPARLWRQAALRIVTGPALRVYAWQAGPASGGSDDRTRRKQQRL